MSSSSHGVRGVSSKKDGESPLLKELVRSLRSDLNMLSNEAKKKFPAVKEVGRPVDICLKRSIRS